MIKLSPRQRVILKYINKFYEDNRYPAVTTDIANDLEMRPHVVRTH